MVDWLVESSGIHSICRGKGSRVWHRGLNHAVSAPHTNIFVLVDCLLSSVCIQPTWELSQVRAKVQLETWSIDSVSIDGCEFIPCSTLFCYVFCLIKAFFSRTVTNLHVTPPCILLILSRKISLFSNIIIIIFERSSYRASTMMEAHHQNLPLPHLAT